jgi:hypothetical protein
MLWWSISFNRGRAWTSSWQFLSLAITGSLWSRRHVTVSWFWWIVATSWSTIDIWRPFRTILCVVWLFACILTWLQIINCSLENQSKTVKKYMLSITCTGSTKLSAMTFDTCNKQQCNLMHASLKCTSMQGPIAGTFWMISIKKEAFHRHILDSACWSIEMLMNPNLMYLLFVFLSLLIGFYFFQCQTTYTQTGICE